MRRIGRALILVGTLAAPVLHADPACVIAPGAEAFLEAAGRVSGWSCEPIPTGRWQESEAERDFLKKVGKWELRLLDTGEDNPNRTRLSLGTKGLRLKVML